MGRDFEHAVTGVQCWAENRTSRLDWGTTGGCSRTATYCAEQSLDVQRLRIELQRSWLPRSAHSRWLPDRHVGLDMRSHRPKARRDLRPAEQVTYMRS